MSIGKRLLWLPVCGIPGFVVLYVYASLYYPGGSQADAHATGFSWVNNYWCNLLDDIAINGQTNAAQPIAMIAMLVLCISLAVFWLVFPSVSRLEFVLLRITQFAGVAAMVTALFLNSSLDHDLITNLASLLGLIAVAGTLKGLRLLKWHSLFWFGVINLVLVLLNNYLYYSPHLLRYLPLVQKISFASFLFWLILISIRSLKE